VVAQAVVQLEGEAVGMHRAGSGTGVGLKPTVAVFPGRPDPVVTAVRPRIHNDAP
jgi:hypothetical protein